MEKLDLSTRSLRNFGITMAVALGVIALLVVLHRHSAMPLALIAGAFLALGLCFSVALKPVYIVWMRFAFILGWVNTRLLLIILFYLVFTPIGLIMRLFGKDLLEQKILLAKKSYWHKVEKKTVKSDYERQF